MLSIGAMKSADQMGASHRQVDASSFCPGDLAGPSWEWVLNARSVYLPARQKYAEKIDDGNYLSYLNYDGAGPSYCYLAFLFIAPPGATNVTFTIPMKLPSGVGSSVPRMSIYNSDLTVVLAWSNKTLTASLVDYSVTCAVTAGTMYYATLHVNGLGVSQAKVMAGNAAITFTGATGLFANGYNRIGAVEGSFLYDIVGRRTLPYQSSGASVFSFFTDADSMVLEYYTSIYATFPNMAHLSVLVNGKPYTVVSAGANNTLVLSSVTLPQGAKRVDIVIPGKSKPSSLLLTGLSAVYLPQGAAAIEVRPNAPAARMVIYGDSTAMCSDDTQAHQSMPACLRTYGQHEVVVEAHGYRSLKEDYDADATFYTLIRQMLRYNPTAIYLAIGTNDYGLNKWSAANFGTAYATLLDNIHALAPNVKIYCQTMLNRGIEGANSFGNTTGDYRTQISTAQSTRAAYCALVDGTAILTANTTYMDAALLHPNQLGASKWAAYIAANT